MQIITTTIINISEENAALIPFIVTKNGGLKDWETPEDAIIRLRNDASFMNAIGQIAPHILSYFGEANSAQAETILTALNNWAISVETVLE